MSDIKLGSNHDLVIVNGDLVILPDSVDSIIQDLDQALLEFLGEWFLDTSQGLPYYQSIFVKNPNLNLIEGIIQNRILDVDGIDEMVDFVFAYDKVKRGLTMSFDAKCTNGAVIKVRKKIGG